MKDLNEKKWEKNSNMYEAKHGLILESKYLIWSLILENKNVEKRREGEKRKREEEEEEEKRRRKKER